MIQPLGWPLSGLKVPAFSQMFKKISWVTSSAKAGYFSMSMAREYTGVWYRVLKASRASLSTWEPR